jgi:hypothetical protein
MIAFIALGVGVMACTLVVVLAARVTSIERRLIDIEERLSELKRVGQLGQES